MPPSEGVGAIRSSIRYLNQTNESGEHTQVTVSKLTDNRRSASLIQRNAMDADVPFQGLVPNGTSTR